MEDISKYMSDSVIAQLEKKGITRQEIEASVQKAIKEREEMGYEGDQLVSSVKLRLLGMWKPTLRSNLLNVKGVVFGMSRPVDSNKTALYMSKLHEGKTGYGPNLDYKVKEGFFAWGFQQGESIPDSSAWEQQGFIAVQYNKKLYLKTFKLTGDWVINKSANNVKAADIIQFQIDPKNLEKETIFINAYKVLESMQEDKYAALVKKELSKYTKDIKTIIDEQYNGFVVIKGSVGDVEKLQNGAFRFDIVDESIDWSEDYNLNTTMSETDVGFIEGAMDVVFIGETYIKKNEPGAGLRVFNTIVPEEYKKQELDKEMQEELANNFDEEFNSSNEEVDEDLDDLL